MGFRKVAEQPGEELVIAGIGRFWKLSGGLRRVESPEQFTCFEEPGYAKVAFNFRLAGRRALDGDANRRHRRPRTAPLRPLLAPDPARQRPDQA